MLHIITLFIFIDIFYLVNASIGDRSIQYEHCMDKCLYKNCTNLFNNEYDIKKDLNDNFENRQPLYLKLLGWDCLTECKYECMWYTVNWFISNNQPIPQFNGKWPFIRILGMQEPVSAIASLLNLYSNYYMLKKFVRFSSVRSQFRNLWIAFALISMNTWLWSTIFHVRDTDFTEKMDYFCAFSLVLFEFNAFFIRVLYKKRNDYFESSRLTAIVSNILVYSISLTCIVYFMYHIYYLGLIRFDYGYNMQVNIFVGALNAACWLSWSFYNYYALNRKHVWQCSVSIVLVIFTTALEVFDFSPILWSIDSHALWHISTIYIPVYWFNFLIEDSYQSDLNKAKSSFASSSSSESSSNLLSLKSKI